MKEFLTEKINGLKPSGIRKFFDIAATMKEVISLGIGEPDFATPDPIIQAGIQSLLAGETHYTSNQGLLQLREAISENINKLYQVRYDPVNEILITVGVSEALYLIFTAILNQGDEVIIPNPCFVSYQAEVELAGGVPVEIPTFMKDNFEPDPDLIERAITPRTKAIFVGYPSNPTGAVASRETLLRIAAIADKHDLLVVSDEIYDRLVYGVEHVCFASLPGMRERTVTMSGFSKSYAMTGWRIGYVAAPAPILRGLVRIHQYTVMSAPTVSQYAALEALRIGEPFVQDMLAEYERRRRLIVSGFNRIGLETFEPRGAFYAFPKVTISGFSDEEFCNRLLMEAKVAMVPGSAFGTAGAGFARASYATSYEKIEEALQRIDDFLRKNG